MFGHFLALGVIATIATSCGDDPESASRQDSGSDATAGDTGLEDGGIDAASDATPDSNDAGELIAVASAPAYAVVGEPVVLDGSGSTGAVAYQWSFGDGNGWAAPRPESDATVAYGAPGRYAAVLTAIGPGGAKRSDGVTVSVTHPIAFEPSQSSSVAIAGDRVAVVSPDSNELALFDTKTFDLVARASTAAGPRSVTPWDGSFAVACESGDALSIVAAGGTTSTIPLPRGSRPSGAAVQAGALFVALRATGEIVRVEGAAVTGTWSVGPDPRAIAALPDGRVAAARFRSPADDSRAEIAVLDPASGEVEIWPLAFDPRESTDAVIGGVPSYLAQLLVSPTGRDLAVPSLQANSGSGPFKSGMDIDFQTTVRAVTSFVDLPAGIERSAGRRQFDDRGFAAAGAWSSHGDYLYVAMRGSRTVERVDVLTFATSGAILDVGFAPQGLALSADDRLLFVDAYMSRELVVYDVSSFDALPSPIARLPIPSSEPLAPEILRGKQLFNDALDPRIDKDQYIACAHCHLDGDSDERVWDFTGRGEGLRNTISLLGRAGTGDGPVHWSANFDEIQDFENDIRNAFLGTGLLSDADWNAGTTSETLGDPKAGKSADLDALAAYVASLASVPPSPWRAADGSLTAAAQRGKTLFEAPAIGCMSCHAGPRLTDSAFTSPGVPRLHDVGTLGAGSGQRLGAPLTGIDTPTLHGLWNSAPYLHDGSAATLSELLTTKNPNDEHGTTSGLTAGELADLAEYLLSLDGRLD